MEQQRLERENGYVLDAVQALSGLIGPSVEAVAMHVGDGGLLLRFWADGDTAEVVEDAEDVLADLEALLLPHDLDYLVFEVLPGRPPPDVHLWAGRLLYLSKPSAPPSGPRQTWPTNPDGTIMAALPEPRAATDPGQLRRENEYVVHALQALLGLITPSVEIIVLHVDDEIRLEFWVNGNTSAISDDAWQAVARMRALLPAQAPPVSAEVLIGLPSPYGPGRYLYSAKLPADPAPKR